MTRMHVLPAAGKTHRRRRRLQGHQGHRWQPGQRQPTIARVSRSALKLNELSFTFAKWYSEVPQEKFSSRVNEEAGACLTSPPPAALRAQRKNTARHKLIVSHYEPTMSKTSSSQEFLSRLVAKASAYDSFRLSTLSPPWRKKYNSQDVLDRWLKPLHVFHRPRHPHVHRKWRII